MKDEFRRWDPRPLPGGLQPGKNRERHRRQHEPILVPVVCLGCLRDLAELAPGSEAYCPHCRRWTSTLDTTTEGAIA